MKKQLGSVDIPMDIIVAVLSVLPVKTLARFRCVSKGWLTLIHSPHFISKHKSVHAHKLIYLIIKHPSVFPWDKFFDNKPPLPDLLESSSLLSFSSNRYISFHGSCNGLVLFSLSEVTRINYRPDFFNGDHSLYIFIWNPSTGKLKAVDICTDFAFNSIHSYGFGSCKVDGGVDDYKVVVKLLSMPFDQPLVVYVYTLSTHSWKRVFFDTSSFNSHPIYSLSVSINGILYWVGHKYSKEFPTVIISFDFQREVFGEITLPKGSELMDWLTIWAVGNYRQFLSLVSNEPDSTLLRVWVMKEYGVEAECWEKLFVISIAPKLVLNSYFGSRVLMGNKCDSSHSVFDIQSQQWIQFGDKARHLENIHLSPFSAIAYNESLDSLDEKWW